MRSTIAGFRRRLSSPTILASSSAIGVACMGGWLYEERTEVGDRFPSSIAQCDGDSGMAHQQPQQQRQRQQQQLKGSPNDANREHVKMIFLGSGSSTGCPKPLCPMVFPPSSTSSSKKPINKDQEHLWNHCQVSNLAIRGDPKTNKNYRNNPCFLIQSFDSEAQKMRNVVIDVGKTFRETTLRWFPIHNIQSLDAIVITHHHMDAAGGADDLRNFQLVDQDVYQKTGQLVRLPTPVYVSHFCWTNLKTVFPWLFPSATEVLPKQDASQPKVKRDVASLDVRLFKDFQGFEVVPGLTIVPLPVLHGDDLVSHGFSFSVQNQKGEFTNVVYLSDISKMIPETMEYIQKQLPPTDILVVDALLLKGTNPVHFNLDQAMALRDEIQPRGQTYLVGMSCDSFPPHDETNAYLKEKYGAVQLAHDGLAIDVDE
ncbi:unnamed protein product [Cylindrotheca closterium]|uniref:Metallo-beta-lactamase domain-containing protein n=1 Tax=Cylindrotheca closterium TaxID=2856 RepID=A0AAD2JND4_9STRA|nr:unnamed protein product [Cylindrotheca closterium]